MASDSSVDSPLDTPTSLSSSSSSEETTSTSLPPSAFLLSSPPPPWEDPLDMSKPIPPRVLSGPAYPHKAVKLVYHNHLLSGKLYFLPMEAYMDIHSRFFDILPSEPHKLGDICTEPWSILHPVHGLSWIHVGELPGETWMMSAYDAINDRPEPSFAAVTTDETVWRAGEHLGELQLKPNVNLGDTAYSLTVTLSLDEVIFAFPPDRPLSGTRHLPRRKINRRIDHVPVDVKDYLPMPVHPDIITVAAKINASCLDMRTNSSYNRPKRQWLKANVPEILDQGQHYLNPNHELWKHRGNEFLFRRDVWCSLCYPYKSTEEAEEEKAVAKGREFQKITDSYYQILFADLQVRPRVPGTDILLTASGT